MVNGGRVEGSLYGHAKFIIGPNLILLSNQKPVPMLIAFEDPQKWHFKLITNSSQETSSCFCKPKIPTFPTD
jgi:uncharacterized protein (DUF779 family)